MSEAKIKNYRVEVLRRDSADGNPEESIPFVRGIVLYPKPQKCDFSEIRIHFVENYEQLGGVNPEAPDKLDPIFPVSEFNAIYQLLRSAFENEYQYIRCSWELVDQKLQSFSVDGQRKASKRK